MVEIGSETPTRRRSQTRERLLDAALSVFADLGVAGASIETICETAGFTRGAFYSNFSSKEELFLELADREIGLRVDAVEPAAHALTVEATTDGAVSMAAVRQILGAVMGVPGDERQWHLINLEFELLALRDPAIATPYREMEHRYNARLAEVIERALELLGLRFTVPVDIGAEILCQSFLSFARDRFLRGESNPVDPISDGDLEWFRVLIDRLVTSR